MVGHEIRYKLLPTLHHALLQPLHTLSHRSSYTGPTVICCPHRYAAPTVITTSLRCVLTVQLMAPCLSSPIVPASSHKLFLEPRDQWPGYFYSCHFIVFTSTVGMAPSSSNTPPPRASLKVQSRRQKCRLVRKICRPGREKLND